MLPLALCTRPLSRGHDQFVRRRAMVAKDVAAPCDEANAGPARARFARARVATYNSPFAVGL